MDFGYNTVNPTATDPNVVLRVGGTVAAPVVLTGNRWEGSRALVAGLTGGNGTAGMVTGSGNSNAAVAAIAFVNNGLPAGTRTRALELWAPVATRHPMTPPITDEIGAFVMHLGELYQAITRSTNAPPSSSPAAWRHLPLPVDDFRLAAGTPYAGIGLLPRSP